MECQAMPYCSNTVFRNFNSCNKKIDAAVIEPKPISDNCFAQIKHLKHMNIPKRLKCTFPNICNSSKVHNSIKCILCKYLVDLITG